MKKRKYILLLMTITLIVPLTGCVKYNANMDIKKDKSMYFSIIYALDTSYFGNQEMLDSKQKRQLQEAGFTITDYKDGKMNGFTISRNIKSIDLVSSSDASSYSLSGILEKDSAKSKIFKVKKGFFKNTYIADFKFDAADSGIDSKSYIESNTNLRKALEPDMSSDLDMNELESSLSKTLDLSFNVTLPYSAISSNASSKNDNNRSLSWNLSSNDTSSVKFEFALYNMTNIYMAIGGGLALLVIIIFSIMNSKNKSGVSKKSTVPIIGSPTTTNSKSNAPSNIAVVPSNDSESVKTTQMNFDSTIDITKNTSKENVKDFGNDNFVFNNETNKSDLQTLFNPTDVSLPYTDNGNNVVSSVDDKNTLDVSSGNSLVNNLGENSVSDKQNMMDNSAEPVTLSLRPIDNNGNAIVDNDSSFNNIMDNTNLNSQNNISVIQEKSNNILEDSNVSQERRDDNVSPVILSNDLSLGLAGNTDTSKVLVSDSPKEGDNQADVPIIQGVVDTTLKDDNVSQEKNVDSITPVMLSPDLKLKTIESNVTDTSNVLVSDSQKEDDNQTDVPIMQGIVDNTLEIADVTQEKNSDNYFDTSTGNQDNVKNSIDLVVNPVTLPNELNSSNGVETNNVLVMQESAITDTNNADGKLSLQNDNMESNSNEASEIKHDISREMPRNRPDMLIEKKILPLDSPIMVDDDINS